MIKKIVFRDAGSVIGTILTLSIIILMSIGPLLTPYDPLGVDTANRLQPVSSEHIMGTDELGRDVFTRLLSGAKYSLGSAVFIIGAAVLIGLVLGGISGYAGGWLDELIMRICDIFMAFPQLLMALLIASALGKGLISTIVALTIAWWPSYTRTVRGMVLSLKESVFVEAAVSEGASTGYIVFRVILPHTLPMVLSRVTIDIGFAMITSSGLSFIGLGAQAPLEEWGAMISAGQSVIFSAWWCAVFPGLAIFLTVLGLSLLGDSIQDALNPRKLNQ